MMKKHGGKEMVANSQFIPTLTIRQVARLLDMHSNTVTRWSDRGIIKPYCINSGGDQRFRLEDIARFLSEPSGNGRKRKKARSN